jgi:epoxide hydrolase-like predicted phosphatase
MIKAVIFDMGGVLLRTEDSSSRGNLAAGLDLTRKQLEAIAFDSPAALSAFRGEIAEREHWQWVLESAGCTNLTSEKFRQTFFAGDRIDEELVGLVRSLRPQWKTGLLSNAFSGARQALNAHTKGLDGFDVVVFSAEVHLAKPDPAIYRLILEKLGVQPEEAVFVDDFLENIAAAQKLGLKTIHFKQSQQAQSELKALLGIKTD